MTDPTINDLSRLSAAEREVLALLSEGHTAKSIARVTGRSVNAVNERLREARRKTGVGSSRELARLVRKTGDQNIGVSPAPMPEPATIPPSVAGWRQRGAKGLVMALLFLTGAAALALAWQPQAVEHVKLDPRLDAMLPPPEADLRHLRATLREEAVDPAWASRTAAALRTRYRAIAGISHDLTVTCGSTICEVAATIDAPDNSPALNHAMRDLQATRLRTDLARIGLTSVSQSFGSSPSGQGDQAGFIAYWSRG